MDDLQEQLPRSGIEYENPPIDRFRGQIAFKCLMDRDSIHLSVVDKPDDLV